MECIKKRIKKIKTKDKNIKKILKKVLTVIRKSFIIYNCQEQCRCSSMVEPQPSKLMTWVRFPLPAPHLFIKCGKLITIS